mgnify:CR=1 FL=1
MCASRQTQVLSTLDFSRREPIKNDRNVQGHPQITDVLQEQYPAYTSFQNISLEANSLHTSSLAASESLLELLHKAVSVHSHRHILRSSQMNSEHAPDKTSTLPAKIPT